MSTKLIMAITFITFALIFYTVGVFSERRANTLTKKHVIIFWLGLVCDTLGTTTMTSIASSGNLSISPVAESIHGITGLLAIVLMLFHAFGQLMYYIKIMKTKRKYSINLV